MKKISIIATAVASLFFFASNCFAKQDINALYGEWDVAEINGKANPTKGMFVGFNMKEHRLYGSTGCNSFFGGIETATPKGKLYFGNNMGATRMYCQEVQNEQEFLTTLTKVQSFKMNKAKTVVELKGRKGEVLLLLNKKQ